MTIYDFIEGGYELMLQYADEAFVRAMDFLDELGQIGTEINIPDVSYTWDNLSPIPGMKIATAPDDLVLIPNFPSPPGDYVPGPIYMPVFTESPDYDVTRPNISLPNRPADWTPDDAPLVPDTDTDFLYPDAPEYTFPDIPVLEDIILPILDPVEYPEFEAVAPDDSYVELPSNNFVFEEEYYSSELIDAVADHMLNTLTYGGTGLNPTVEQAIWDRERNREDQAALKAKEETRMEWAKRGYTLPPGMESRQLADISQQTQNNIVSLGRDIMIKQAELEQENIKHAIVQSISLEGQLVSAWNQIMQRKFEVARYTQETAINIFNAQLALYNSKLQAYNIEATVYNILVQGEMLKVEAYKAQVEAQSLIADINRINVQIYSEQVNAIRVLVDTYKAELDAVKTKLEGEKLKVDIYLGELQGWMAEIDAYKTQYETYAIAVDAETSKIQMYSADIAAYSERIGAWSKEIDAESKISDIYLDTERLNLDSHLAKLSAYTSEVEAESTRIKSETDAYVAQVNAYSTKTGAYTAEFQAGVAIHDGDLKENVARTESELKQADINITKAIEENKLLIELTKAGALVSSEVAAAALTAVNLAASMSASGSESTTHSYNYEV